MVTAFKSPPITVEQYKSFAGYPGVPLPLTGKLSLAKIF